MTVDKFAAYSSVPTEADLAQQALEVSMRCASPTRPACCALAYQQGRCDALNAVLAHLDRLQENRINRDKP